MRALRVLAGGLALLMASAALAADVPAEADRLLWCGSAMYWLSISASDAGNDAEADLYQGWADTLTGRGAQYLISAGFAADAIDAVVSGYDERVVVDLKGSTPPHDAAECPALAEQPAG
jgi:hypothetical protein